MATVDIPINDFDYESLLDSFDVSSNKNTTPTTEIDTDSRISDTPPLTNGFNNPCEAWPWNMESPLSDDPHAEHYDFDSLINDENPLMLPEVLADSDNSTLDDLLAGFELPQQHCQDPTQNFVSISHISSPHPYPSPPPSANIVPSSPPVSSQRPIILPRPSTSPISTLNNFSQPQITNCVKVQSFAGIPSNLSKCVKIEPIINTTPPQLPTSNITIITTTKPITVAKLPVIKMPLNNTNTVGQTNSGQPIAFVKTEAESIASNNIKRITTVYPSTTSIHSDGSSLSTGNFLKALNSSNLMSSPPNKRRRSESSNNPVSLSSQTSEFSTLTLDQLKVQYGNVSEEALKKHLRMIKNRESASLSRKRRKQLMENLEVKVKELTDENERLKNENSKLVTRVHTLEMENELLKTYKLGNGGISPHARKPLILMGIVLLVVFNIFTLRSLSPQSTDLSGSMEVYLGDGVFGSERTLVRGRTILSAKRGASDDSFIASGENFEGATGNDSFNASFIPGFPYWQCLAYINKTHSQRINRELHSWVQDHYRKQQTTDDSQPVTITDSHSITISSNSDDSDDLSHQHMSRKVALLNRRSARASATTGRGQLQPYKGYEPNYDDFIHNIDRKNDTLYFVSFKRDHLILPATVMNQTQRPKMSLILPASITHLNKSIHVPPNHIPMIQIDCEVEDTKLVFIKRGHIPSLYQQDLFRYYASVPQTTV